MGCVQAYLHEEGICHGRVRPESVQIGEGNVAKIGDLTLGQRMEEGGELGRRWVKEARGSGPYAAPEVSGVVCGRVVGWRGGLRFEHSVV